MMGFQTVRSFALTVCMKGFLPTALRIDLLRQIWRHSLACGILCDELAQVCSATRDDRAYTAGLLHNIGSLGLVVAHPRTYAELLAEVHGDCLLEKERSVLGIDHSEAGGWLARNWGFPDLRHVVVTHHAAPRPGVFETADLVRVAVLMTDGLGFAFVPAATEQSLSDLGSLLPHAAQYRFDPDPEALTARITTRLDSFD